MPHTGSLCVIWLGKDVVTVSGVRINGNRTFHNNTRYKEIHVYKPPLTPVLYLMEEYANHIKKDYKKPTSPLHFDTNSFMNTYDKTRKNNLNSLKDTIMRNFVEPTGSSSK